MIFMGTPNERGSLIPYCSKKKHSSKETNATQQH